VNGKAFAGGAISAALLIALGAGCAGVAGTPVNRAPAPQPAVAAAPAAPAPEVKYVTGWGDGTYMVGNGPNQIPPGTYTTDGPKESYSMTCWARLRNTSGEFSAIIANDAHKGPGVVTIQPTDVAVQFTGGAIWIAKQ